MQWAMTRVAEVEALNEVLVLVLLALVASVVVGVVGGVVNGCQELGWHGWHIVAAVIDEDCSKLTSVASIALPNMTHPPRHRIR